MSHTTEASVSGPDTATRRRRPASPISKRRRESAAQALARRVVCVPRQEIATHVAGVVRAVVDAERQEAIGIVDSELVDRLGSSYTMVAELVVQLMERQRTVIRLQRQLREAQQGEVVVAPAGIVRPSTPVNA